MKRGLVFSILLLAILFSFVSCTKDPKALAEKAVAEYTSAKEPATKIAALEKMLSTKNTHGSIAFYGLLQKANESDLPHFREAVLRAGSVELLLHFNAYLKLLAETQKFKALDLMARLIEKLEKLNPEIASISRKNPDLLVNALVVNFQKKQEERESCVGPLIGLTAMREDGASCIIKSVKDASNDAKELLALTVDIFGELAVFPILREFENPRSTKIQREILGVAIYLFPDSFQIYDKVVEAYCHGRFFKVEPQPKNMNSLEYALGLVDSWWGNLLKSRYRDNERFIAYVARKYLNNPRTQALMIEFLADVNFEKVTPYFARLNFAELEDEALNNLFLATHVSDSPYEKSYKKEKYEIFNAMFCGVGARKRAEKEMIFNLSGYLPEDIEKFVRSNIGILTAHEKRAIVFFCSPDNVRGSLPAKNRNVILAILNGNVY